MQSASLTSPVSYIVVPSSPWFSPLLVPSNPPSKMYIQRLCALIMWLKYCHLHFLIVATNFQSVPILFNARFTGSEVFPADLQHTSAACHLDDFEPVNGIDPKGHVIDPKGP